MSTVRAAISQAMRLLRASSPGMSPAPRNWRPGWRARKPWLWRSMKRGGR